MDSAKMVRFSRLQVDIRLTVIAVRPVDMSGGAQWRPWRGWSAPPGNGVRRSRRFSRGSLSSPLRCSDQLGTYRSLRRPDIGSGCPTPQSRSGNPPPDVRGAVNNPPLRRYSAQCPPVTLVTHRFPAEGCDHEVGTDMGTKTGSGTRDDSAGTGRTERSDHRTR